MSNYGNPPSDPYGQNPQDPAGQGAPPAGYGQDPHAQPQNPYGGASAGQAAYGAPHGVAYASWGQRAAGAIIDGLLSSLAFIPAIIGLIMFVSSVETTTDPVTGAATSAEATGSTGPAVALIGLGVLLAFAFAVWNTIFRQGNTGYSIGKGVMGIKLVKLETGLPVGAGMAFVRYLVTQAISGFTCGVGGMVDVLWPLWDDKNQTLHDKVVSSIVIVQPKG